MRARQSLYRAVGLACLLLLLASPGGAQEYPPELPPLPSPELVFRSFGFLVPDPLPVAEEGEPVTIDVLCVVAMGVDPALCSQGVARINTTIRNSGQGHITVRQVGPTYRPEYFSGGCSTDLSRFAGTADGFMDEVHALRDQYGADTLMLIGTSSDCCGVAYLLAGPTSAFAYTNHGCLLNSSFEHEWGHLIGMAHDAPNASWIPNGYAAGWCFGNGRKDVLTYPSPCGGSRAAYYSNPDVLDNGTPTGTATANNARMLRERAPIIAGFRLNPIPAPRAAGAPVLTED